jgi:hypothetical protein
MFYFLLTVGTCPPNSDSKSSSIIPSDDIFPLITPRLLFEFDVISLLYASVYIKIIELYYRKEIENKKVSKTNKSVIYHRQYSLHH